MHYVLIVTIISSFGAVDTQRITSFHGYQDCATEAVGRIESMRPLYSDSKIKWECERE